MDLFKVSIIFSTIFSYPAASQNVAPQVMDIRFQMFAYRDGINGLSVFAAGGLALIGDTSSSDESGVSDILYMMIPPSDDDEAQITDKDIVGIPSGDSGVATGWTVYPERTNDPNNIAALANEGTASESWLALMNTGDIANPVGFISNNISSLNTPTHIWWLFGNYVEATHPVAGPFAHQINQPKVLWQLMWSESKMPPPEYIPVTLRTIGPTSTTETDDYGI